MKNKRGIALVLALFAAILLWSVWPRADGTRTSASDARPEIPGQDETRAPDQTPSPDQPESTITHFPPGSVHDPAEENYRRQLQAVERSLDEWRTPIAFYGRVVDETMQPVAGVAVSFGVTDLSAEGHSTYQAESDSNGLFSLQGVAGKHLSIKLYKPSYYVSRHNPAGFFYAGRNDNFIADASQPVLFHLRQHGQAEPLHVSSGRVKVPLGGTSLEIDLISGQPVTTGGHLRLVCHSQPDSSRRDYDWSLRLIVPGGGIQTTEEEFPFLAPDEGYHPELEIAMDASEPQTWENMIRRSFFIRLPDGRHGRMSIFFVAYNGVLRFDAAINPSGSRNLEYREAVQP